MSQPHTHTRSHHLLLSVKHPYLPTRLCVFFVVFVRLLQSLTSALAWPVLWVQGGVVYRGFLYVYILPCCCERGVRGHLFNWLILSPMLWQSKCYLQPHCTGAYAPFTLSTMRTENLKWKSGPVLVFQEIRRAAMRCTICPHIWLRYSVSWSSGNFRVWAFTVIAVRSSLCFTNHDDFNMFYLNVFSAGYDSTNKSDLDDLYTVKNVV